MEEKAEEQEENLQTMTKERKYMQEYEYDARCCWMVQHKSGVLVTYRPEKNLSADEVVDYCSCFGTKKINANSKRTYNCV